MLKLCNKFRRDEDGAVTVDWIVLTAAVVGLSVAAVGVVQDGVNNLAQSISTGVSTKTADNGD